MRIGVLADTHIPDRMSELPRRVLEIFEGVEIVLHAGDIAQLQVLEELLGRVSLTFAVFGEADPPEVRRKLQESQILEFGGRRIGLVHGHGEEPKSWLDRLHRRMRGGPQTARVQDQLLARFPDVDAIVYGHTHQAFARTVNGVFMFNPGSPLPNVAGGASVGLLEITAMGIRGRIVPL